MMIIVHQMNNYTLLLWLIIGIGYYLAITVFNSDHPFNIGVNHLNNLLSIYIIVAVIILPSFVLKHNIEHPITIRLLTLNRI